MSYTYEKLPGEAILILSYSSDYRARTDGVASIEEGTKLLEAEEQPVFLIIDFSRATIGLDDVIAGATIGTRQTGFATHPKIRETLLVTQSRMLSLAARGLDSVTFGHVKIKTFDSRDAAIAYARKAG